MQLYVLAEKAGMLLDNYIIKFYQRLSADLVWFFYYFGGFRIIPD